MDENPTVAKGFLIVAVLTWHPLGMNSPKPGQGSAPAEGFPILVTLKGLVGCESSDAERGLQPHGRFSDTGCI